MLKTTLQLSRSSYRPTGRPSPAVN